jgi:hypothetical protein
MKLFLVIQICESCILNHFNLTSVVGWFADGLGFFLCATVVTFMIVGPYHDMLYINML